MWYTQYMKEKSSVVDDIKVKDNIVGITLLGIFFTIIAVFVYYNLVYKNKPH